MKKDQTVKRNGGGYYVISEITDTQVKLYPYGGGFSATVPMDQFQQSFVAAEVPTELTCGPVILDGMEAPVQGWYSPHQRWNGWLMPYVALDDCLKLLDVDAESLIDVEDGYRIDHPELDETYLTRCTQSGLEDFYYIDGFCWEEE